MNDHVRSLSKDQLEAQLCELAAHIAAATYRWLVLLAEFDRRVGWEGVGLKSCAHWLTWKCGIDIRTARDKIRVAHALGDLPLISEAFSKGELSYSKVRAITRIATPETEKELLIFAIHGTTQHVEKLVRSYRRCAPPDPETDRYRDRYVEWHYDDDGSLVLKARLAPEEGALVVAAINKGREVTRVSNRRNPGGLDGSAEPPRDRADALIAMAERELSGTEKPSSSAERYQVMVHVDMDALAGSEDGIAYLQDGSALRLDTVKQLLCDCSVVPVAEDGDGNVLGTGKRTRTISSALRRSILVRDGGCTFPGCTNKQFYDAHHIEHWIDGGEHELENLVSLCRFHHRLMHNEKFGVRLEADGTFTFLRPDGDPIVTKHVTVEPGGVENQNGALGIKVDRKTVMAKWEGEVCDYGVAVECLLRKNGHGEWPRREENGSAEPLLAPVALRRPEGARSSEEPPDPCDLC